MDFLVNAAGVALPAFIIYTFLEPLAAVSNSAKSPGRSKSMTVGDIVGFL